MDFLIKQGAAGVAVTALDYWSTTSLCALTRSFQSLRQQLCLEGTGGEDPKVCR